MNDEKTPSVSEAQDVEKKTLPQQEMQVQNLKISELYRAQEILENAVHTLESKLNEIKDELAKMGTPEPVPPKDEEKQNPPEQEKEGTDFLSRQLEQLKGKSAQPDLDSQEMQDEADKAEKLTISPWRQHLLREKEVSADTTAEPVKPRQVAVQPENGHPTTQVEPPVPPKGLIRRTHINAGRTLA